jgi:hypothetical protein
MRVLAYRPEADIRRSNHHVASERYMKTTRLLAAALGITMSQIVFAQNNGKEWLNPPNGTANTNRRQSLSDDLFFEVVASKMPAAIDRDLQNLAAVALDESSARNFTGSYFHCPAELRPFLLRAVYGHGGTGRFFVSQMKKSIFVEHGSLGRLTEYKKSALVACLRDAPDAVYITIAIAE